MGIDHKRLSLQLAQLAGGSIRMHNSETGNTVRVHSDGRVTDADLINDEQTMSRIASRRRDFKFTKRGRDIFSFIIGFTATHQRGPSVREVAEGIDVGQSYVRELIYSFTRAGLLTERPYRFQQFVTANIYEVKQPLPEPPAPAASSAAEGGKSNNP